jgi:hypothetical protein
LKEEPLSVDHDDPKETPYQTSSAKDFVTILDIAEHESRYAGADRTI